MPNTRTAHQPVAYLLGLLCIVQMLGAAAGIFAFSSAETFLGLIFGVEALYFWSQTSTIDNDGIHTRLGFIKKTIRLVDIINVELNETSYTLHLKDSSSVPAAISPKLNDMLHLADINTSRLDTKQTFKIKHNMVEKLSSFQALLCCAIWQNIAQASGSYVFMGITMAWMLAMLLVFVNTFTNTITYSNETVKVRGILRVRQLVSLNKIERITIQNICGIVVYSVYWKEKRIFRSLSLNNLGTLCMLAQQAGATIDYHD